VVVGMPFRVGWLRWLWPLGRYKIIHRFLLRKHWRGLFHDVADDEHHTIEWQERVVGTGRLLRVATMGAEIMETANSGASFGFGQVGSVAVNVKDHVTAGVSDDGIGMGCAIVEEMSTGLGCGLSALRLGCRESAEGYQYG
jgi:hypothetical protein